MENLFKNFAIMMPLDIVRLPSGTAAMYASPEDKENFVKWLDKNMPSYKELEIEEIQGLFKYWKQIK